MRNYYLEILELSPSASERDIKVAYRRLSKKYHPDRNAQADAEEKFIEVTQAYEYLTKPQTYSYSEPVEPEVSEYERWRQQARERVRQQKREEAAAREALIRKLLSYFNYVALGMLIFNVLLAIDFILPRQAHSQTSLRVEKVFESSRYSSGGSYQYDDLHFEDFTMRINKGEIKDEEFFEEATVLATVIFRKPQAALLTANGQTTRFEPAYSIYQIFGFLIPLMLLLLGVYWYGTKLPENRLGLAIFMSLILLIQALSFMIS